MPKLTVRELREEIVAQWDTAYHNASLLLVDLERSHDYVDYFEDWLAYRNEMALTDLAEEVAGGWRSHLTFAQYGRGGATVLPSEWCNDAYPRRSSIAALDEETLDGYNNLEVYNTLYTRMLILMHMNDYVKNYTRHELPEDWAAYLAESRREKGEVD